MPIDDGTELAINMEGVRLGTYRIEREIGRGGMGTVYLATRDDAQFEKQVAIKVVKLGMTTDDVLERFRRDSPSARRDGQPPDVGSRAGASGGQSRGSPVL